MMKAAVECAGCLKINKNGRCVVFKNPAEMKDCWGRTEDLNDLYKILKGMTNQKERNPYAIREIEELIKHHEKVIL